MVQRSVIKRMVRFLSVIEQLYKKDTSKAVPRELAHWLQDHTFCSMQNSHQWGLKWPTGQGKRSFGPYNQLSENNHKQAQLGVPHSRIQVELGLILQTGTCQILNFAQNTRQSQSVQGTELNWGVDTSQKKCILGGRTPGGGDTGRRGHRTYFLNRVPLGGGDTAHTF